MDDLAEALYGFVTQQTRLLRLSTPLGPDALIVECVRGEESLSGGFSFHISALSTNARISLRTLIGQPALLQLLTATSTDALRPFHGHITAVEQAGANGALARYLLTVEPWLQFLGHTRDSRVFQDQTVFDILDTVFGSLPGKGKLNPRWRFDIADRAAYTVRSVCTQYQESDLNFVARLMHEEGLFFYFEHSGAPATAALGEHTLVIADHNAGFKSNSPAQLPYAQASAVIKHDTLNRWQTLMRAGTTQVQLSSWDYRTRSNRPVGSMVASSPAAQADLSIREPLGAYAYESRARGQRRADMLAEALAVRREQHIGAGTVRTLAPGRTFGVTGHARVNDLAKRTFLATRVLHLMHNNLTAEIKQGVHERLRSAELEHAINKELSGSLHASRVAGADRPLYRMRVDAVDSALPWRDWPFDEQGQPRFPRPQVHGQQTAIVVGPANSTIHTDRDHRIKIQFHWQRGAQSHSRLAHPTPDGHTNAPGDERAGTWVRVATPMAPVAGTNWGSHALPRVGQEVLVDFFEGDIDRPVVIAALHNGSGQADSPTNQKMQGAGSATGNAPTWFPGAAGAYAHPAVLSGYKSQELASSAQGDGGYGQLIIDDTAAEARIALQRHAGQHEGTAELNLGHLRHQSDSQRLGNAGLGVELKTQHSVALRAGQGMLLSSAARHAGTAGQLDAPEAVGIIEQSAQLQAALASTAQQHKAQLKSPDGSAAPAAEHLPAHVQMKLSGASIGASSAGDADGNGQAQRAASFDAPILQLSSPAGIVATTPASILAAAGNTSSIAAGMDLNMAARSSLFAVVRSGIGLFTYGKAQSASKPNQETGIKLHAASGTLSCQSQAAETRLIADKSVTVASITKSVSVQAKQYVLLTAQGAYLKLEGGNIMLHGPGKIEFKASSKELAGPSSAHASAELPKAELKGCASATADAAGRQAGTQTL